MDIYSIIFSAPADSWLSKARHHDQRASLTAQAIDIVSYENSHPLIVLPAGLLRASTVGKSETLANDFLALSRRCNAALVFGIDVIDESSWAPLSNSVDRLAFVCDSGRPILWPIRQISAKKQTQEVQSSTPTSDRCALVCGIRVGILISSEVFQARTKTQLRRQKPDLILVLTHAGINEKWKRAISKLDELGPTILTGQQMKSVWTLPQGWHGEVFTETPSMTIYHFRTSLVSGQQLLPMGH